MTAYTFETMTAAQAAAFTASDTLVFSTTLPNQLSATFVPSTGTLVDTIVLSNGTVTQTFGAAALSTGVTGHLVFPGGIDQTALFETTGNDGTVLAPIATTSTSAIQAIFGFAGNDVISVTGTVGHLADGGSGADTIIGSGTGAIVLEGGTGADSIVGGAGNYHIWGNNVANSDPTNDGNDTITIGVGSNYVNGNAGDDSIIAATGGTGTNRLIGGSGNDTIVGGDGVDSINGNLGNDSLNGGIGDDYVRGGQGNDVVLGGAGNDQLFGDVGNDTITGGTGIDVLTGGAGNDLFVFAVGDAGLPATSGTFAGFTDSITDFKANGDVDTIDLASVTGGQAGGTLTAKLVFATGATFTTEAAAQNYAQGVLAGASTAVDNIVALQVGGDTYLFSHEGTTAAGNPIDTVIKLAAFTATNLAITDFI